MSSPLTTIRSTLQNKLSTLLANKAIVYSYYESNPAQYPCLLFDIASQQNEFITNLENMHVINFRFMLLVQQADENTASGLTEQEATIKLDTLTDTIITSLENDYSLGSTVDYCTPAVGTREIMNIPNGIARVQNISLAVKQSKFA